MDIKEILNLLKTVFPPDIWLGIVLTVAAISLCYALISRYYRFDFRDTINSPKYRRILYIAIPLIWIVILGHRIYQNIIRPPIAEMHVAVANFWSTSPQLSHEGEALRILIEEAVKKRTPKGEAIKVKHGALAKPIRNCDQGKIEGKKLNVHIVVGGQILTLGSQVRTRPFICLVYPLARFPVKLAEFPSFTTALSDPGRLELAERQAKEIADVLLGIYASVAYMRRDFSKAIRYLKSSPYKSADMLLLLGNSYLLVENPNLTKAKESFTRAIRMEPTSPTLLNNLASVYLEEKNFAEAERLLRKAVEIDERYVFAFANLGYIEVVRGNLPAAAALFEKAAGGENARTSAFLNAAYVYLVLDRYQKAEDLLERVVQEEPNWEVPYNMWGLLLMRQRKYGAALLKLEKAISLNPNYSLGYNSLGQVLFRLGKTTEAIRMFEKALEINPVYSHAINNLGVVLMSSGEYQKAEEKFQMAIKVDRKYPDPWGNLVTLYLKTNRMEKALEAQQKYNELKKDRPPGGLYPVPRRRFR